MAATNTVSVSANRAFFNQLRKYYTWYTGGFIVFLIVLAWPSSWDYRASTSATRSCSRPSALYAGIGIMSRTADVAEYYVAGRRVPALFNGMATGADWMSAASFIGMAGTLYLAGFDGLVVRDGVDRWLLSGGVLAGSVPTQVRPVHDSGFSRSALRRQHHSLDRHCRGDHLFVRLRRRADLRRRPDHQPLYRPRVRNRCVCRPRRHIGVLDARRHAGGDLDAGRAVHHFDHRVSNSRYMARRQTYRRSDPAARLRSDDAKLAEVEKKIFADPREADVRKIYSERVAAAPLLRRTR